VVSGDHDLIGEPDGETGENDRVEWMGQVICIYPSVRRPFRPSAIAKVTAVDELMLQEFLAKYTKKVEG
jgi:hypothetical protein